MDNEILTVHVTKHFGNADHEHTFHIYEGKTLNMALSSIRSFYGEYENMEKEHIEKQMWDEFLKTTPFENKQQFDKWMEKMKDYDLCCLDFSYEDYARDTIKTAIRDAGITDYDDLDEIEAALSEMKSALIEISETVSGAGF